MGFGSVCYFARGVSNWGFGILCTVSLNWAKMEIYFLVQSGCFGVLWVFLKIDNLHEIQFLYIIPSNRITQCLHVFCKINIGTVAQIPVALA